MTSSCSSVVFDGCDVRVPLGPVKKPRDAGLTIPGNCLHKLTRAVGDLNTCVDHRVDGSPTDEVLFESPISALPKRPRQSSAY
jgi:hypothetical protein